MDGSWKGPIPVRNWLIAPVEGKGLGFQAGFLAFPDGGRLRAAMNGVRIQRQRRHPRCRGATSFVNYHDISGDPAAGCEKISGRRRRQGLRDAPSPARGRLPRADGPGASEGRRRRR